MMTDSAKIKRPASVKKLLVFSKTVIPTFLNWGLRSGGISTIKKSVLGILSTLFSTAAANKAIANPKK